jgi:hypothetical protein
MNRLRKFLEKGAFGEGPIRTAYVLDHDKLPPTQEGRRWQPIADFKPADELLGNSNLKQVFEQAIRQGYAVVTSGE